MCFGSEFPESLVSNSKGRDFRAKTRIQSQNRTEKFNMLSIGLGIGLEDLVYSRFVGRKLKNYGI